MAQKRSHMASISWGSMPPDSPTTLCTLCTLTTACYVHCINPHSICMLPHFFPPLRILCPKITFEAILGWPQFQLLQLHNKSYSYTTRATPTWKWLATYTISHLFTQLATIWKTWLYFSLVPRPLVIKTSVFPHMLHEDIHAYTYTLICTKYMITPRAQSRRG